ncbi:hypothetical protein [Streptomyces sp. 4F14]|uniref:hypothetical protein n=1 Tax=Streptomyces sp. 4F14 TaxID=3394380 RepID=UPI003A84C6B2
MLDEAAVALAASVGTAVAQAAGTDAWTGFRTRLARVLGRGDRAREAAQAERLERSVGQGEAGSVWRARVEDLLEELEPGERAVMEEQLRAVVRESGGNVFYGPAAVQSGNNNVQVNRFGRP